MRYLFFILAFFISSNAYAMNRPVPDESRAVIYGKFITAIEDLEKALADHIAATESPEPMVPSEPSEPYEPSGPSYYASTTGTGTWAGSTDIGSPCSLSTAVSSAQAGDTIVLRGGTYILSSALSPSNSGSPGATITLRNHPGETPILESDGLEDTIYLNREYWTFDGLTVYADNVIDTSAGVFSLGDNVSADHTTIQNCYIWLKNSVGRDNISCIRLQSDRADYALIRNNVIRGQGWVSDTSLNAGIMHIGGGNTGSKVLNNEIYECSPGIQVKHNNVDTSIGEAEIAYNWVHDCDYPSSALATGGIYGNPIFMNIHDNITNRIEFGDNGGGDQGRNCLITNNTVFGGPGIRLRSPTEGPISNCTITNNIFPTKTTDTYNGDTEALNTWDYNMYGDDQAIGQNDIAVSTPSYAGGTSPTNVTGFALVPGSDGYRAGSDGEDIGADISSVGIQ